jgi:hypothetical protein
MSGRLGPSRHRSALADARVAWRDVQFAFAGSYEVDSDAVVNQVGLTGLPFTDVYHECATAASALSLAASTIPPGGVRPRHRDRHGQAPAGRARPRSCAVAPRLSRR